MAKVVEYDNASRKPVWTCGDLPSAWGAVRLKSGNTLVSGEGGGWVREIDPQCKVVGQVARNDLPGIALRTVQECSRLANGNTYKDPNLLTAFSLRLLDEPGIMENREL